MIPVENNLVLPMVALYALLVMMLLEYKYSYLIQFLICWIRMDITNLLILKEDVYRASDFIDSGFVEKPRVAQSFKAYFALLSQTTTVWLTKP